MSEEIVFFHHPRTRGRAIRWMLEETSAPYRVELVDLSKRAQRSDAYLALNPMGKVPAIVHHVRGERVVVTETPAICMYLGDAFPEANLAPRLDDPARGAYVRWFFFASGCLEPAIVDRMLGRPETDQPGRIGYGTREATLATLEKVLTPGPYVLGDRFTAVDVFIGALLGWGAMSKTLDPTPTLAAYSARLRERPAAQRASALDTELALQLPLP